MPKQIKPSSNYLDRSKVFKPRAVGELAGTDVLCADFHEVDWRARERGCLAFGKMREALKQIDKTYWDQSGREKLNPAFKNLRQMQNVFRQNDLNDFRSLAAWLEDDTGDKKQKNQVLTCLNELIAGIKSGHGLAFEAMPMLLSASQSESHMKLQMGTGKGRWTEHLPMVVQRLVFKTKREHFNGASIDSDFGAYLDKVTMDQEPETEQRTTLNERFLVCNLGFSALAHLLICRFIILYPAKSHDAKLLSHYLSLYGLSFGVDSVRSFLTSAGVKTTGKGNTIEQKDKKMPGYDMDFTTVDDFSCLIRIYANKPNLLIVPPVQVYRS